MWRKPLAPRTIARVFATLAAVALGGCSGELYDMTTIEGDIKYEDGTLIPAGEITLRFLPLTPSVDPKRPPKLAMAGVDVATGGIGTPTTYQFEDGLIAGRHKVIVRAVGRGSDMGLVPKEFTAESTTPLEIDTEQSPIELRIRKPSR